MTRVGIDAATADVSVQHVGPLALAMGLRRCDKSGVRRRLYLAGALFLALSAVAGCGSDSGSTSASSAAREQSSVIASSSSSIAGDTRVTVTTASRPATSPVPTGGEALTDGAYFGFIRALDKPGRTITFDVAQWMTGPAANAAAAEDGYIQQGETVPNDYYVRNASTLTRTIPVSPDIVVSVTGCIGGCGMQFAGSFDGLADSFGPNSDPHPDLSDDYRGPQSRYWVTIQAGSAVRIDEQYVP